MQVHDIVSMFLRRIAIYVRPSLPGRRLRERSGRYLREAGPSWVTLAGQILSLFA